MKLNIIRNVQPNRNLYKKVGAIAISIIVMLVSFIVISNADRAARDTVSVVRVKAQEGLNAQHQIQKDDVESYPLIAKEYKPEMITADKIDDVIGKYTKNYFREGTILYKDQVLADKPLKNEWLYQLASNTEVITIPYNYLECGGDILTPGDRVRIRVSYEGSGAAPGGATPYGGNKVKITAVLFDSIVVKDMLNSSGHSIYEVYKEVIKMDADKRQQVMQSEEFIKNIQPRALMLEGARAQIDNYAKFKGLDSNSILVTILSRKDSSIIVDQLPTLQKEVESWIKENKK